MNKTPITFDNIDMTIREILHAEHTRGYKKSLRYIQSLESQVKHLNNIITLTTYNDQNQLIQQLEEEINRLNDIISTQNAIQQAAKPVDELHREIYRLQGLLDDREHAIRCKNKIISELEEQLMTEQRRGNES